MRHPKNPNLIIEPDLDLNKLCELLKSKFNFKNHHISCKNAFRRAQTYMRRKMSKKAATLSLPGDGADGAAR